MSSLECVEWSSKLVTLITKLWQCRQAVGPYQDAGAMLNKPFLC